LSEKRAASSESWLKYVFCSIVADFVDQRGKTRVPPQSEISQTRRGGRDLPSGSAGRWIGQPPWLGAWRNPLSPSCS